MKSGFWQVAVEEEDRFKTTFSIPVGHYEWNVMHFGLKHEPSIFQKVMNQVFKPYFDWIIVYIDDVLIFSKSVEEHFKHVQIFTLVVKRSELVLSKKKMELFQKKSNPWDILYKMAISHYKSMHLNLFINFQI